MPQELPVPAPGTLVRVRGDDWRVLDATRFGECALTRLAGVRPTNEGIRRTLILPFDKPVALHLPSRITRSSRRDWMRRLRKQLLATTGPVSLRAGVGGRFELLPYQLEPALACLRGEPRLLLADEVGLGKTIQAAIILAELFARDPASRAIVLTPASLGPQWVAELRDRFHLPVERVESGALRQTAAASAPGDGPWAHLPLAVASIDYVKQAAVTSGAAACRWDALVVDEAHLAALAPERSRAVRRLAARARHVVLLTATPHAADDRGYRALCATGRFAHEPPILLFRRTRASLGLPDARRILVLRIRLSDAERRMHAALERYTRAVWRECGRDAGRGDARLAMIVLCKRAASGPAALESSLARRLRWLSSTPAACPVASQLLLPLDDPDAVESADAEPGWVLGAPGLRDTDAERNTLARLLDLATAASVHDRKARVLQRFLARAREPAIVFTEYRDTLERLASRLGTAERLVLLHGGLDETTRREAITRFTSGHARILLATDAAAHGLNLQARCRLVVNMELPWTPARLEQRVGRVDRIGQRRLVHAVHLVGRSTAEHTVLTRLVLRVHRAQAALDHAANPLGQLGELDVAAAVLGTNRKGNPPDGQEDEDNDGREGGQPTRCLSLETEAREECARLQWMRQLATRDAPHAGRDAPRGRGRMGPRWTVIRREGAAAALPRGVVCLFAARFVDARGALVEERLFALLVEVAERLHRRRDLAAALPALVAACRPRLEGLALSLAEERLHDLRTALPPLLQRVAVRESAITSSDSIAPPPVQAGLFDRRADKKAHEDRRRRNEEAATGAMRVEQLSRAGVVALSGQPELVLVLGIAS